MRATSLIRSTCWGAVLALLLLHGALAGEALADSPDAVSVQYRLLQQFAGLQKSGGKILMTVTNHSSRALPKLTVRLADASAGRLTGPVQESIALAAGETRQLEGFFVLDTRLVQAEQPLDWIVVSADPEGFAQQMVVRGEPVPAATMDADARAVAR